MTGVGVWSTGVAAGVGGWLTGVAAGVGVWPTGTAVGVARLQSAIGRWSPARFVVLNPAEEVVQFDGSAIVGRNPP